MSDKSRNQEDHSCPLKTTRGPTTVPQLVSAPGLVPHHATSYTIHSDSSLPLHTPHHLTYGMIRGGSLGMPPALAMPALSGKGRVAATISNDLGPPIFMPSLNLGVPKSSTVPTSMPAKPKNSITQSSMSSTLVSDILSNAPAPFQPLSAFHPMRPNQPPSAYIAHPHSHPHPNATNMSMKLHVHPSQQPVVVSSVSKGTPLPMTVPITSSMPQKQGVVRVPSVVTKAPGSQQKHSLSSPALTKPSSNQPVTSQPVLTIPPQVGKPLGIASASVAMISPEGESPPIITGHMTYVTPTHLPTMAVPYLPPHQGLMATHSYQTAPQPHSTLSKMLLTPSAPIHQQNVRQPKPHSGTVSTFVHSSSQAQPTAKPGSGSSHSSLPTSQLSTSQKRGGTPPPDGYFVRGVPQGGHNMPTPTHTTSGEPSSSASYTDTKLERPPQPSAVPVQNSVPGGLPSQTGGLPSQTGPRDRTTADVASGIIISVPGLTGKHIAALTSSGTLQQMPPGYLQPGIMEACTQSAPTVPTHHLQSQQSMAGADTIYVGQPSGASQVTGSLSQGPGVGVASSPGLTMSPNQGNSSPRPRILRKRAFDGNWKMDGPPNTVSTSPSPSSGSPLINKLPLGSILKQQGPSMMGHAVTTPTSDHTPTFNSTPLSPGGEGTHNHLGSAMKPELTDVMSSPRKKPRKQNVVANDDQYASNVPNSISSEAASSSSSSSSSLVEGPGTQEERPCPPPLTTMTTRSSRRLEEAERSEEAPKRVEIRYLSQLRRSPYPINGVYRIYHRAAHNHFKRHADIKHREEERVSAYDIASKRSNWQRAGGWKLHRFALQLDEMSKVEGEILKTMERLQNSIDNLGQCRSCDTDTTSGRDNTQLLKSCSELVKGNTDRSNRIISHVGDAKTEMLKVLDQKPHVMELLEKFSSNKSTNSFFSSSASQKSRS